VLRIALLSMLCCASASNICGMKPYNPNIKTVHVSRKVTARSLQEATGNRQKPQDRPSAYVAYSPDKQKKAIASSYYCSHFLNYGTIIHSIKIFTHQSGKPLYQITDTNERELSHIKFVNDNTVRVFYKGSDYIGSDTVLEWQLDDN
jgi:hypothetical protein